MEKMYDWVKNYSVSVYETEKEVVFMKKISAWWASKSYWVDVAKLAGIPKPILEEARYLLKDLEQKKVTWAPVSVAPQWLFVAPQPAFTHEAEYEKLKTMLKGMDLNNITPLQALQFLVKIKDEL